MDADCQGQDGKICPGIQCLFVPCLLLQNEDIEGLTLPLPIKKYNLLLLALSPLGIRPCGQGL